MHNKTKRWRITLINGTVMGIDGDAAARLRRVVKLGETLCGHRTLRHHRDLAKLINTGFLVIAPQQEGDDPAFMRLRPTRRGINLAVVLQLSLSGDGFIATEC